MNRTGRCICGLKVAHHFKRTSKAEIFLTCERAKAEHPKARVKSNSFRQQLLNSGAK